MNTRHLFLAALLFLGAPTMRAQSPQGFGDVPIEITVGEGGETRMEAGVAVADKDVSIHYGETSIYVL